MTEIGGSSSGSTDSPIAKKSDYQYEERVSRISKENAFMVLAMWMEQSLKNEVEAKAENEVEAKVENEVEAKAKNEVEAKAKAEIKAGAVLVTEENRLYAMDCTRDGVHAIARLLMKHSQKLKNSTIYTSRRPCSFCAKLLVQCGVSQLYYLPTEPEEADDDEDLHRVDNLLKVAKLAHGYFVPDVDEKVTQKTKEMVKKISTSDTERLIIKLKNDLMSLYWKDWKKEDAKKLHWTACDDKMRTQFKADFDNIMEWISEVTVIVRQSHGFVQYPRPNAKDNQALSNEDKRLYRHLLAMAQIFVQRTDDPKTGVGAVFWKTNEKQIVATGWNGFPAKALYGEFPRASDKDEAALEKKYPYVIHAEQNALLMRNTKDLSGSTLFVTKVPCNECVPLLKLEKVDTFVIGITEQEAGNTEKRKPKGGKNLNYDKFFKEAREGNFTCFVVEEPKPAAQKDSPAAQQLVEKPQGASQDSAAKRDPSSEQSANSK